MADNTVLNSGSGGDTIRTEDRTTYKTPVTLLDVGGVSAEAIVGDSGVFVPVEGAAAENAAVAGNPILVGARYDASGRTLGDGDVGAFAIDADGALHIADGGNSITVDWNGTAPPIGAGTEATALRVTLATDSTGVVSVDDNGGALTVDNAGTFAVQEDGAALTALQLIDDAVYADDADWTDGTSKHILVGGLYQSTPQSITDGDVGPFQVTANGYLIVSVNGTVTVDGSGVTQPVSGTVTANLSATDNAVLDNIDTNTTNVPNVIGTDGTAGPTQTLSIGGTESGGNIQELRVDSDGHLQIDVLSGGGGGTQYAVDDPAGGTDTGTLALVIRDDTLSTLTPVDGDYTQLRVNSQGALHVTGGGGGTEYAVDDALGATPTGSVVIAKRDDALSALTPIEGDAVELRVDANGALWTIHSGTMTVDLGANNDVTTELAGSTAVAAMADDDANPSVLPIGAYLMGYDSGNTNWNRVEVDDAGHLQVDVLSGGGGGTQYAVDDALGATPTGTLAVAIRDDALSALTPVEGDAIGLRVDANGALWVIPSGTVTVDNGGTFAVQEDGAALTALQLIDDVVYTDDTSTHSTGSSKGALFMAAATPTDGSVDANDIGAVAMSTDRRLLTDTQIVGQDADLTIADGGNVISVDDGGGVLSIDWNGTAPPIGAGTEAAALRVTVATDSTGVVSVDDGGANLSIDWAGTVPPIGAGTEAAALRVTLATDSTGVVSIDDNGGSLTVDQNATVEIAGELTHSDPVSTTKPLLLGAEARSSEPTAVSNADIARLLCDGVGKLIQMPFAPTDLTWQDQSTHTSTTANVELKAAGGAGVRNYITDISVSNSSATPTEVIVKDGTTEIYRISAPADGGAILKFSVPLKGTAATAINCATADSVATVTVSATGFTGR